MREQVSATSTALRRWTPWIFLGVLILYLRPYTGIRHDATLYLAQALYHNFPGEFQHDLFFIAGSQASFTLFPRILAALLDNWSAGPVFLWMTLLGRVAFYAAAWRLLSTIFPPTWRLPAVFALACLPTHYGAFGIFSYAEPFLTPRIFSEALSLMALACLVRGRRTWLTIFFLGSSALLHPLQAISAGLVAWCWLTIHDRRWLFVLLGIVPMAALAALGVPPLNQLFEQFDAAWMQRLLDYNPHVLLLEWSPRDWCVVLTDVFLLTRVRTLAEPGSPLRPLASAALIATCISLGASALLGDMLRLVLPVGLQIWRTLWIVHLLSMAALPWLITRQWQIDSPDRIQSLLLVATAALGAALPSIMLPWAVLGLIPLYQVWPAWRNSVSVVTVRFVQLGICLAALIGLARYALGSLRIFQLGGGNWDLVRIDVMLMSHPLVIAALVSGLGWIYMRSSDRGQLGTALLTCVALAGAAATWDARSDWSRAIESATNRPDAFGTPIKSGTDVYWYSRETAIGPWLVLNRASYFSPIQMSGQMFNRGTAILSKARKAQIGILELQAGICEIMDLAKGSSTACWASEAAMQMACRHSPSTSAPEYIVLPFRQPEHVRGSWSLQDSRGSTLVTYYLYQCSDWGEPSAHASATGGNS